MRAVWSYWSRPYQARAGRTWSKPLHHFLAWGLSLECARKHYPETVLITDTPGKRLLIDVLGLRFEQVSTELDRLNGLDPDWWCAGKLAAYSVQDRPFVHIDTDVFLWKPIPLPLASAPVFTQCPEYFPRNHRASCGIDSAFRSASLELPEEWQWAVSRDLAIEREENTGILGANQTGFIRAYAGAALRLAMDATYAPGWARAPYKSNFAIEQFFLGACVDYHRQRPDSPFRGVRMRYLFRSWEEACNPAASGKLGFTHLLGDTKSDPLVGARLEERMKRDHAAYFRHCERVAAQMGL